MVVGFSFKQFDVAHGLCAQKVSSDACLFGGFVAAHAKRGRRVLDIGAGSGLLTLMLAQKLETAHCDAVEISEASTRQCRSNFENSPWSRRLRVFERRIQDFHSEEPYDVIIANPPFFSAGRRPHNKDRIQATHQDELPLDDLATSVDRLLGGEFWCLLPPQEQSTLSDLLTLKTTHYVSLRSTPAKQPHLTIACYQRGEETTSPAEQEVLTVWRDDRATPGRYHETFERYLKGYYLWV